MGPPVKGRPEAHWQRLQKQTFTRYINSKIRSSGLVVRDLYEDVRDGRVLYHFLEALTGESLAKSSSPRGVFLRRIAATPRLRRGYSAEASRGDAAAGDVAIPRNRGGAAAGRGYSAESRRRRGWGRGYSAESRRRGWTWLFRGEE